MIAKEMFAELGYKEMPNLENEMFIKHYENDEDVIYFVNDKSYLTTLECIDMPLLKAINQQCKELGWIE